MSKTQNETNSNNRTNGSRGTKAMRGKQGRKDNNSKRVNFDNVRRDKFDKDVERMEQETRKTKASNDIRWYAKNPELLNAAASLPYANVTGLQMPWLGKLSIPGVLALYWDPVIGNQNALNQATNDTYSFTVHANSRNTKYNGPDEMLLIMAGAEVFSTLAEGIRVYGCMRRYEQENYYTPKALVTAMGYDFDDLQANLANMWFDLNELVARATQIWIPNSFPLIERWFWLNSNVYTDANSIKAQMYLYVQRQHFVYQETTTELGGQLAVDATWGSIDTAIQNGTYKKWSDYTALVNRQINALLRSEDRGIIFGDILKAYGSDKLYSIKPISSDYTVAAIYDSEVLTQIENAVSLTTAFAGMQSIVGKNIIGNNWGTIPAATINVQHSVPVNQVLNFHQKETPTPAQNMIATRLKPGSARVSIADSQATVYTINNGSEVVHNFSMFTYTWSNGQPTLTNLPFYSSMRAAQVTAQFVSMYSAFDWAPWVYVYDNVFTIPTDSGAYDANYTPTYTLGDYDNCTLIENNVMSKMNTAAIYSELGMPTLS